MWTIRKLPKINAQLGRIRKRAGDGESIQEREKTCETQISIWASKMEIYKVAEETRKNGLSVYPDLE